MAFPSVDAVQTYGGPFANSAPVVDPTTDQDAAAYNAHAASTAAMTATCGQAWARFVTAATTGAMALAASNSNNAAWGNAPAQRPTLARSALGVFTVTWPTTIVDGVGVTQTVNLRRVASVLIEGATLSGFAQAAVTSGNVVTVYTFTTAFAASDLVGVTVHLEVG